MNACRDLGGKHLAFYAGSRKDFLQSFLKPSDALFDHTLYSGRQSRPIDSLTHYPVPFSIAIQVLALAHVTQ